MPLLINLHHLADKNVLLEGELSPAELDLEDVDELIQIKSSVFYNWEAQKFEQNILAQGEIKFTLQCHCVRCLKSFEKKMNLENWVCHIPLEGEEKAEIISNGLDLTPYLREDILFSFPQHPLCEKDCPGLLNRLAEKVAQSNGASQTQETSSAWAELNKLKF
ncbi:MAG: YceD family protein [Verrucomicrobiota bacterium]|nr:YceD family protein [Verrucomicrobiota bacterium]